MSVRVTPLQAIERNGLRGFGLSVFIARDDAAHSDPHQAPSSSPAACPADPVGSPLPGSADPFTDTGPQVFSDQEPS